MNYVKTIRKTIKEYAERFPCGHWSFLGPGSEKKWHGTHDGKQGSWNRTAEKMLQNFAGSGHPIFRCTSLLREDNQEAKKEERQQFTSTEVRKILSCSSRWSSPSINQLSLYRAVADMIAELPVGRRAPGKPVASGQLVKQEILTQPPLAELQANEERQGNLLQEYVQRFEKLPEDQFFYALPSPRGEGNQSLCENKRCLEIKKGTRLKGRHQSMYDLAQSRT